MSTPPPHPEHTALRARRRSARRRRRVARLDVAIGLLLALVLVLATPGLAVAAVIALLVLGICLVSVLLERVSARRQRSASPVSDEQLHDRGQGGERR
jgi:Flp pilus assembly protein TadB